jgi:trans-aconitate 2-methyltransferase
VRQATWDPEQYLRHEGHRLRPFLDLLARVPDPPAGPAPRVADLGCGTGNVTALITARWPAARVTGFDNSDAMLRAAAPAAGPTPGDGHLDFRHADLATWEPDEPYDLIITNAALHWVPGHRAALPRWAAALAPGGTLALQVPGQGGAPSHRLLAQLCDSASWRDRLAGLGSKHTGVEDPAGYLALLAGPGRTVDAWETTYAQQLPGEDAVLDWVKGTGLRPVLTALEDDPAACDRFVAEYGAALRTAYPRGEHGTVYPFRRVFAVVTTAR